MNARKRSPRRAMSGFTLVEVLVSILLFSFGVLGVVGLQARLLQSSTQNGDRSRASMLANEIVSQMWAQGSASLAPETVAAWQARVGDASKSGLPNGSGTVDASVSGGVTTTTVTITWRATTARAGAGTNRYVTTVVIQ